MISKPLDGLSTTIAQLEKIWQCLMNDNTSRVGVYGMGGVGKTTIVTHIYNRLKDENSFQHVHWVTVSKESNIYKLQRDIVKEIKLDLSEEDERKRAVKLWEALNKKKKFVLIVDDVWESYELEEVGIPTSVDGGKLLLTTREYKVCKGIKCEEIVKIEPLSEQEAMDLFTRESGHQIDDNSELRSILASVAKECDGLPLAIITLSRSTRAFVEIYEWRNILQELQKPSDGQNHEMEKVFKVLKISYDHLRNDKYRQCLLYCALHPEDYSIDRYILIQYWIAEGLIDELKSRQAEFDKGNSIINELINASLLECLMNRRDPYGKVKMHDVVRDMALTITRENFLVLKDFPKFTDWSVNLERISIMDNPKLKMCPFNLAPNCSKLRTLLMQEIVNLTEFPSCFFDNMQNITVLDMSCLNSLRSLPDSIAKLKNLRFFNLRCCYLLEHIPSLAGLENLWHLDLSETNLKELPKSMEGLVNLKVLDISEVKELYGSIPSEVLEKLPLLQSLKLQGSNIEVEPDALSRLENLETLDVEFKNFDALNSYLESKHWERLGSYYISNIEKELFEDEFLYDKTLFLCKDRDWDSAARKGESSDFVIPFSVKHLALINFDSPLDGALRNGESFAHLRELALSWCKFNYLISVAFAQQLLQNIRYIRVDDCDYIEEIIGTEEESLNQSNQKNYPTIELPNLRSLLLYNLPRLRSIYRGKIKVPSLEDIQIDVCEKLERLPFLELSSNTRMLVTAVDPKLWWDSLKWDDPNVKKVLQPSFYECEDRNCGGIHSSGTIKSRIRARISAKNTNRSRC